MIPWPSLRRHLVAILRGVRADEAVAMAQILAEAGFEAIEVPLNSPAPFDSIERVVRAMPSGVFVGAGTVLSEADVTTVHGLGGRMIISPNTHAPVIARTAALGLVSLPGVFTPSEAFTALAAGASALKFFPASALGAEGIGAMRAVLPRGTVLGAVGGVGDADYARYLAAGVTVFGLGSSLYSAGLDTTDLRRRATSAVLAYDEATEEH